MCLLEAHSRIPPPANQKPRYTAYALNLSAVITTDDQSASRLPKRKREILYARTFRALAMGPALLLIFTSNELIRHCFLRRQAGKLPLTLRCHAKHSHGFSFNLRILLANPARERV